jgi:hypothetical protein
MYTIVFERWQVLMTNEHKDHSSEVAHFEHEQPMERRGRGRHGAKTFRRGRALAFYQQLVVKRDTLRKQLTCPEYQSIQPVIAGELKATEAIINEFKAAFELQEVSAELSEDQPE